MANSVPNFGRFIWGNIELAEDDIKPEAGASEFLNEAKEASLRVQELTKQLIIFSKGGAPVKETGSVKQHP